MLIFFSLDINLLDNKIRNLLLRFHLEIMFYPLYAFTLQSNTSFLFRRVSKISKIDFHLRHICLSVSASLSVRSNETTRLPRDML
jgi:hypothetical protein